MSSICEELGVWVLGFVGVELRLGVFFCDVNRLVVNVYFGLGLLFFFGFYCFVFLSLGF